MLAWVWLAVRPLLCGSPDTPGRPGTDASGPSSEPKEPSNREDHPLDHPWWETATSSGSVFRRGKGRKNAAAKALVYSGSEHGVSCLLGSGGTAGP